MDLSPVSYIFKVRILILSINSFFFNFNLLFLNFSNFLIIGNFKGRKAFSQGLRLKPLRG